MATQVAGKRQQREEYRRKIQEQAERVDGDVSNVKMPKKRFFRQRAHANVFSDHNLD
jgi:tRNA (guanine-N7-)-methyltransferase